MNQEESPLLSRGERRRAERKMAEADALVLSPNERAELVLNFLLEALDENQVSIMTGEVWWDLVCFCTEFLNAASTRMGDRYEQVSRILNGMVYSMHYEGYEEYLLASRDDRIAFWNEARQDLQAKRKEHDDGV